MTDSTNNNENSQLCHVTMPITMKTVPYNHMTNSTIINGQLTVSHD